ncbi:MAG: LicD family protein, partial [Eggerthellaceae bacterium]|nr:LicD family protein [Eggerthellaceae bacterium]
DGPLLEDVQAAGGTVRALGRLASAAVAAWLRDADVYLLPSRSEGFATTLLEACAMGAFPVSTDVGGVTELGIGEIGGAVLPDMSAASIAGALQAVASMPDECRAQADALMARVRERNTWEESARALESLFDDLNKTADDADATAVDADTNDDDVPFEGDERLDKLHRVLLMMMKDFAAICEREGLTWMAHYGTAIGALRHGGFIPWDDDIDICMFRSDLERFEQAVQADTSGKYSIVNARTHAGYPLATTRFILNGTEFRDSALATMDFPSGIFLDLFPLDELADGRGAYAVQVVGSWLFNKLATAKLTANPYIAAKGVTATAMSAAAKVARGALNLPGVRELDPNKVAHKLVTSHGGEKTKRAGYPFDTFPQGCIYNADDLLPVRWIPFEDMLISVPNKVEQQLTDYYGDWMTPPPGNERKEHYPDILDFGEYADL